MEQIPENQSQFPCDVHIKRASPYDDSPFATYAPPPVIPERVPEMKQKRRGGGFLCFVLVVVLCVATCVAAVSVTRQTMGEQNAALLAYMDQQIAQLRSRLEAIQSLPPMEDSGLTPGQIYGENIDSVVRLYCLTKTEQGTKASTGTGLIWTEDGYIITNYHVVDEAEEIRMYTSDGAEHQVRVLGWDDTTDLALLKTETQGLKPVRMGSSDALSVGDRVVVIGHALGEETPALTVGFISAKNRIVATEGGSARMLQTDTAINSGNSGGPLFDSTGAVVGIITSKQTGMTPSGAAIEGVGYAIPVDMIWGILEDLKTEGYVKSTYLGVMVMDLHTGLQLPPEITRGVYVDSVTAGGAADRAGLRAGDVILALGGYSVEATCDLTHALRQFESGETTTITVQRGSGQLCFSVTLVERPANLE